MAEARRVCPSCGEAYGGEALFCPRDGAPLARRAPEAGGDPYVGLRVAGDIQLERLVGIGSMGRVYRARQAGIDRSVAVKILDKEHARDPTLAARFHREGRVAGGLSHPNIVVVHAAGNLEPQAGRTDGEPFLVMEFLDGMSLRSALAAGEGRLALPRAIRIMLQICDAVGEAHARGIVRRDLKPENVMLVPIGADPDFVKVLDFGVARVGEADSSVATHAGAILGTAVYACPESARGDRVAAPGDVYSIATLLFECLAGRAPFIGTGPVDILIQHAQAPAPELGAMPGAEGTPEPIARLVARNLGKSPADRSPDARELGRALLAAAEQSGLSPTTLTSPATLTGRGGTSPLAQDLASTTSMVTSVERKTLRDLGSPGGAR
jgi:serine/threonine protein kinase